MLRRTPFPIATPAAKPLVLYATICHTSTDPQIKTWTSWTQFSLPPFFGDLGPAVSSELTEPGWDPEEIPDVKVIADSGELLGRVKMICVSLDDSFRAYHFYNMYA